MLDKKSVELFWEEASCGEELYLIGDNPKEQFNNQSSKRYELEPYIFEFADFEHVKDKKVLEIGVGLGSDHQKFAEFGADLYGIDLTERAMEYTKKRLDLFNLSSKLSIGDAENLNFEDNSFNTVYSWGVIHHSPNTQQAINEIHRVLKKDGKAKIMIYHKYSIIGYMLWLRYALFSFKPFTSLRKIYSEYLESPGTKAYTIKESQKMFKSFSSVKINTVLTHGDLMLSDVGQRHRGIILSIARKLIPRFFIKSFLKNHGLYMLIEAKK